MSYLGLQESGLPALVVDVLETWDGDWFSIERLGAVVEEHRPGRYPPGLRDQVKIMVGGALLNQEYADQVGADGYAPDANSATRVAKRLLDLEDSDE